MAADKLRPPGIIDQRQSVFTAQIISPEQLRVSPQVETVIKTDSLVLLTGTAHPKFAREVGKHLSRIIHEPITVYESMGRFSDGSIKTTIEPNLRNRHVFFVQGIPAQQRVIETPNGPKITMSINDAELEVYNGIDAARRASAAEITVVTPYHFNSRQDRKDRPHVSISAARTASDYQRNGTDRIVTIDLHAEQEQGFVGIPWDNVYASHVFIPEIQKLGLANLVVVAPDAGGVKRAEKYRDELQTENNIAIIHKGRDTNTGEIRQVGQEGEINGDVKDKPVLMVDDMIGSGKTAEQALKLLRANGATQVYFVATHAFLSEETLQNLRDFTHVFVTDTVNHDNVTLPPNMTEVSVAPLFAEVIKRIHTGESISKGLISNRHDTLLAN